MVTLGLSSAISKIKYDIERKLRIFTLRASAAQCIVIGPVCGFVIEGGRAVYEPYYSQRDRSVCVSERFFIITSDGLKN